MLGAIRLGDIGPVGNARSALRPSQSRGACPEDFRMGRSRYKFAEADYPHFITCTIVGWKPLFTRPDLVEIVLESWRFLHDRERMRLVGYVIVARISTSDRRLDVDRCERTGAERVSVAYEEQPITRSVSEGHSHAGAWERLTSAGGFKIVHGTRASPMGRARAPECRFSGFRSVPFLRIGEDISEPFLSC